MRATTLTACLFGVALSALVGCGPESSAGPFHWDSALVGAGTAGSGNGGNGNSGTGGAPLADGGASVGVEPSGGSSAVMVAGSSAGGSGGSAPLPNAFDGMAAYASAPVAQSALSQMTKSGLNPTKTQCLSCHTGDAGVSAFLAGGTLFLDAAGSMPAVDFEVRVIDSATNQPFTTHTDENGNFWLLAGSSPPAGPFLIGVRNAEHSQTMPIMQRGLECNGSACHGGMQGPVHVL